MKSDEEYYNKILLYSQAKKENSIIIDDSPTILKYASSLGIKVIHSCLDGQNPEFEYYFTSTQELLSEIYLIQD